MNRVHSLAISVTIALLAGGAGYYLADPILALAIALIYGVGSWATVSYYDALPDTDDWHVVKWNGAWIFTVVFAGNAVLNNTFDVPLGRRISQLLLLYGAAWVGYMVAVAQLTEAARIQSESDAVGNSKTT
jgi:hypothetical protein